MAEAVDDEEGETLRILPQAPGIAAFDFAFERDTDRAEARASGSSEARHDDRAFAGHGVDVELVGQPAHRAEAGARRARRGVAVGQAALDVGPCPGRDRSPAARRPRFHRRPASGSAIRRRRVEQQVVGELGGRDRHLAGDFGAEFEVGERLRGTPRLADLAGVVDDDSAAATLATRGFVTATSIGRLSRGCPRPPWLSMSNSLTSRFAPVRPMPSPLPEVQPSVIARSRLGMPGPSSANLSLQTASPVAARRFPSASFRRGRRPARCAPARWRP